jgi:hypothetical protein
MPGFEGTARVDILSLEDFHARLNGHLAEAQRILHTLNYDIGHAKPELGTFQDGRATTSAYRAVHTQEIIRAERLVAAIQATKDATAAILANYQTTEAQNNANAADIAAHLGGVSEALHEAPGSGRGGRTYYV